MVGCTVSSTLASSRYLFPEKVYVHSGAQHLAAGNTRGAVGVVDTEYADMDGDEVWEGVG